MRKDPYISFRFRVEVNGIINAHASEVSGLQSEIEIEPYEEGGVNYFVHQLPKRTKYQNLVLKRGFTELEEMWTWHQDVIYGTIERKEVFITLIDTTGAEKWFWIFYDALPVKWTGPEFKAESGTVAFEAIEFAHHGFAGGPL